MRCPPRDHPPCPVASEAAIEKLIEQAWSHTLYRDGDDLVLAVVCGTVGLYERTLILSQDEAAAYRTQGDGFVDRLAAEIRRRQNAFSDRFLDLRPPE